MTNGAKDETTPTKEAQTAFLAEWNAAEDEAAAAIQRLWTETPFREALMAILQSRDFDHVTIFRDGRIVPEY